VEPRGKRGLDVSTNTPYLTLAGAAGLFAALLVVNGMNSSGDDSDSEYGSGGAATTAPTETSDEPTDSSEPTEPEQTAPTDGGAQLPAKAVFAGHTRKSGPAFAIAVLDGQAAAYFCDGVSAESWLTGETEDGAFSLTGKGSDAASGRLAHHALVGKVTVQGQTYRFSIPNAKPPAGLYRAEAGGETTIGWIILPDGSQVGIESDGGATQPAPPLTPGSTVAVGGEQVEAEKVEGDTEFGSDE
jgi:hypothetical protein